MYELYGMKSTNDRISFSNAPIAKAKTIQNARVKAVDALHNGFKSVTVWKSTGKTPLGVVAWGYQGPIWLTDSYTRLIETDGYLGRRL